jgi:hypothetical protein
LCLWLSDNIVIFSMEKQAHPFIYNRLWAHAIFRKYNHWKIEIGKLFVKLVMEPVIATTRFSDYAIVTNPNPCVWALLVKHLT